MLFCGSCRDIPKNSFEFRTALPTLRKKYHREFMQQAAAYGTRSKSAAQVSTGHSVSSTSRLITNVYSSVSQVSMDLASSWYTVAYERNDHRALSFAWIPLRELCKMSVPEEDQVIQHRGMSDAQPRIRRRNHEPTADEPEPEM